MTHKPRFLYRYYKNEDYIFDVIRNKRLYHCHPKEFNDPFDCKPLASLRFNHHVSDDVWLKFLFYFLRTQNPELPEKEIQAYAEAGLQHGQHRNNTWLKRVDKHFKHVGSLVRVCCFATSPRNMMMWEHYAANHSGLAFQFRVSGLHDAKTRQYRGCQVNYTNASPGIAEYVHALSQAFDFKDYTALTHFFYGTKTKHWRGEEEIRFFTYKRRKYLKFNQSTLSGVIFGSLCKPSLMKKVKHEFTKWHHQPVFFKGSIESSYHKLYIERLNEKLIERCGSRKTTGKK